MTDNVKNHKKHRHFSPVGNGLLHLKPLPSLPDEVIIEILLRLPVRSLLLFKCVCKSWKTLISDSKFAKTHLQSLTNNPTIAHQRLFYDNCCEIVSFPMKSLLENSLEPAHVEFSMEHKVVIFGSCNGLLCLFDVFEGCVKLRNPSNGFESKKSPKLDYDKQMFVSYNGFGYDHVNDKYKVLVVVDHLCTPFSEKVTQIYTFGGNSWTTIQNFPCPPKSWIGKFVSGTLNWLITKNSNQSVILSFDLAKETYNELLLPKHDGVIVSNLMLGVLTDRLCVSFDSNDTHWDFWLMKKYGVVESWTRLMMISKEKLWHCCQALWEPTFVQPMFIFENGIVLMRTCSHFVSYNLNNGKMDTPLIRRKLEFDYHIYRESLVSPQL